MNNNYLLSIKINSGLNYFPHHKILVNEHYEFSFKKATSDGMRIYEAPNTLFNEEARIVSLRGINNDALDGFLPFTIEVNGDEFLRQLESFYIRAHPTEEDIATFFNLIASKYEKIIDKSLNMEMNKRILNLIGKLLPTNSLTNYRILDYGVGTGLSYLIFKKKRTPFRRKVSLFGCDISEQMLKECASKKFMDVKLCNYGALGYKVNFFDAIFASFVVHFFIDNRPFEVIYQLLKPKGYFIFNVVKPDSYIEGKYARILYSKGFSKLDFMRWNINTTQTRTFLVITAQKH